MNKQVSGWHIRDVIGIMTLIYRSFHPGEFNKWLHLVKYCHNREMMVSGSQWWWGEEMLLILVLSCRLSWFHRIWYMWPDQAEWVTNQHWSERWWSQVASDDEVKRINAFDIGIIMWIEYYDGFHRIWYVTWSSGMSHKSALVITEMMGSFSSDDEVKRMLPILVLSCGLSLWWVS